MDSLISVSIVINWSLVSLLPDEATDEAVANAIDAKGRQLV